MNNNADRLKMFPPGIEPGTFCVLDRCDNHYTTETYIVVKLESFKNDS